MYRHRTPACRPAGLPPQPANFSFFIQVWSTVGIHDTSQVGTPHPAAVDTVAAAAAEWPD